MTTTMRTVNVFSAHPAWGLGGAVVGNASERCNQPTVTLGGVTHYVRRTAMVLLMMMLTTMTAWAWEGDGSKDNPYQISRTDARS